MTKKTSDFTRGHHAAGGQEAAPLSKIATVHPELPLANGYYVMPPGKLANLVTCLEMRKPPALTLVPKQPQETAQPVLSLTRLTGADLTEYRRLFQQIGEKFLWFSRSIMPDEKLIHILNDERVAAYVVSIDDETMGLMELDFREEGECELAFFGLLPEKTGKGLGDAMMRLAIQHAWLQPIHRLWLHTCHFDHAAALPFYHKHGFQIYQLRLEVHDDPRLKGFLPETAAAHVPLLKA